MHPAKTPQFVSKAKPRVSRGSTNRQSQNARRNDRAEGRYAVLPPIAKINVDAHRVVKLVPGEFTYMELHGYALRVSKRELAAFQRHSGNPNEDDWMDFLTSQAEARWNGEWIPMAEALRLDEEAGDLQEAV